MSAIDEYLKGVKPDQRAALQKLRKTIRAAAPKAEEGISYGLAAFRLHGKPLVAFGAGGKHCSFFPMTGHTVAAFRKELKGFETSKGTIRFEPDRPLPAALVKRIVKVRITEIEGARGTTKMTKDEIAEYAKDQTPGFRAVCKSLRGLIDAALPKATSKVWHGSPVWFMGENPVVGYCAKAKVVQLLFWNGRAIDKDLAPVGKYGAAEATFADAAEIDAPAVRRWLRKARTDVFDSKGFFQKMREKSRGPRSPLR
jgi:uncharacterized protein YdhG (YjbR/CyaY superfamily)